MTACTLDTNVAVYAFSPSSGKVDRAQAVLERADFVSVQLLNEFTHVARRKMRLGWPEVYADVARLRAAVENVLPIDLSAHQDALRIAGRYQLAFYDALMLSVALIGGARTFYSEDMQHGLVIDDTLTILNPFLPEPA